MENRATMKNIKVEIEDYPKDDCMKIGRIFIVDIFENRFIKLLIVFYLIFNIILFIIQSYIFLSTFESSRFVIHSPLYFATSFLIVTLVSTLKFTPSVEKWLNMMKLWKMNIDGKFHQRFVTESKLITIYLIINAILGLFCGFLHAFPSKGEKQIFFAYDIFKEFPPMWENILSWIYASSFIMAGMVMPANCSQLVYSSTHVRYQIYILMHHIENVNRKCDTTTELHLTYDENYQKEIKHKLTLIGKRIHHITRVGFLARDEIQLYAMLICITGVALGISILILFIKVQDDIEMNYLRIFALMMAGCSTSVAVIIAGQKIENMNEEGWNIFSKLNWYTWNKENKQIYLILLLSQTNPFKLDITDTISINYNLGLRLVRALYSVATVLKPSVSL